MMLRVDSSAALPVYEQIRTQIARLVAAGQLARESRVPTIRQLATDLGLAKGTVERAYDLLESDGVIETRGRRGSFVVGASTLRSERDRRAQLDDVAASFATAVVQFGLTEDDAVDALKRALADLR